MRMMKCEFFLNFVVELINMANVSHISFPLVESAKSVFTRTLRRISKETMLPKSSCLD